MVEHFSVRCKLKSAPTDKIYGKENNTNQTSKCVAIEIPFLLFFSKSILYSLNSINNDPLDNKMPLSYTAYQHQESQNYTVLKTDSITNLKV